MPDGGQLRLPEARDLERVVPPTGAPAVLTILTAAAMAMLAVFAVTLVFAADRLADRWTEELGRAATLRITAPGTEAETRVADALAILSQTPGVASARALTEDELTDLLTPWLGAELPLAGLDMPRLIEVTEDAQGVDAEGLRVRLAAEVPGASFDDHTAWRDPLVEAAERLRLLGWVALALILSALVAMVILAVTAALAANAQVISVLRTMGAEDRFVTRAFTRRFTLRVLAGAGLGAIVGALGVLLLPKGGEALPTDLGLRGAEWLALLAIPLLAGAAGFITTRYVALRRLREAR